MKLKTTETPIMSGGDLQMKGFQIAASAKAFRILSSNLYKNKIRAIIRELSCNAVDGHIANGNKGTFDVHMPGMLDPQFKIRDYGCGMDDETIMNLYTTYFASTKSDSNDYIGALGLGSKSPFSYTDSFTVVSYFEGMRRAYAAFIKDGEPTITKVSESETDEPNGIEITVPVNTQDIPRWKEEARYVFTSFGEIRPKMFGGHPIDFLPHDKTEFEVKQSVHGAGVFAIMGNIVYPLPPEVWTNTMINLSMKGQSTWGRNNTSAYYVRFELGELDITPSREELSLDDETMKNIKERIKKTDVKLSEGLIKEVSEHTHVRKLKRAMSAKYNQHYWSHIITNPEFVMKNGKTVAEEIDIRTQFVYPTFKRTDDKGNTDTIDVPMYRYDLALAKPRGKLIDRWMRNGFADFGKDSIDLFINDKKSGAIRTMKGLRILNKTHGSWMYMIDAEYADEVIKQFKKCWHDDELNIFWSSKCDDARKANPTAKKAVAKKAPNTISITQKSHTPVALYAEDIKKLKGFWIPMFNNEYVSTERRNVNICSLASVRQFMKYRKIDEIPVIKATHWEQVKKNPNITEVWDEMIKLVVELEPKLTEDIFPFDNSSNSLINNLRKHDKLKHYAEKLSRQNPTTEVYSLFKDILKDRLHMFTDCPSYKANEKTLKNMLTRFDELAKLVSKKSDAALQKFQQDNPLICFYLNRSYGYYEDRYVNDIIKSIKL